MAILAAIDETARSKTVVRIAYDLATTYEDTLIPLHVIPKEEYEQHRETLLQIEEFDNFSISQGEDSARRIAETFVQETIEDVDRDIVEPRGRVGDVANEILSEAERVDPQFLVISGRRRSPTGKAIFGSKAQQILLNANCPVVSEMSDE